MLDMPSPAPHLDFAEQQLLAALGERLRLARLRRQLTATTVAQRAGISRTTLHKAETGDGAITLGTCLRVLAALGLEADLHALAADGQVARRLQDQAVLPERELWAHKRERQARDLNNVHTGKLSNDDMSWFAGGKAKAAKLVNSVY